MSGAGNRFLVTDEPGPAAVDAGLRTLASGEPAADGLLQVLAGGASSDCTMTVFNADGGRAEACGNGLRCAALFARERGLARGDELIVGTDAGPRRVTLLREDGAVLSARAEMGSARVRSETIEVHGARHEVALVDVGNPHCVLFVRALDTKLLHGLGATLQDHPAFPAGVNLELVVREPERLVVRVFERGVGETAACGTGACAAAAAAVRLHGHAVPVTVDMPGGRLTIDLDARGTLWLTGPVRFD